MSDTEFKLVKPDSELVPADVRHGQIVCDHLETCVRELAIRGYIVSRVAAVQSDYEAFLKYVIASNHQSITAMGWQHPEAGYIDVAPLVPATSGRPEHISTFDTSDAQFAVVGLSAADRAVWLVQIDAWRAGVAQRPADGSAYEETELHRATDDGMPEPLSPKDESFDAKQLSDDIQSAINGHRAAGQAVKRILMRTDIADELRGYLGRFEIRYIDKVTGDTIPVLVSPYALSDPFVIVAEAIPPSPPADAGTAEANVPAAESVNPDAAEIAARQDGPGCAVTTAEFLLDSTESLDGPKVTFNAVLDTVPAPCAVQADAHNDQDDDEDGVAAVLVGLAAMGAEIQTEAMPGTDSPE